MIEQPQYLPEGSPVCEGRPTVTCPDCLRRAQHFLNLRRGTQGRNRVITPRFEDGVCMDFLRRECPAA